MEQLTAWCDNAKGFLLNLNQRDSSSSNLRLHHQLDDHAERFFSSEKESSLDFWELSSNGKGAQPLHDQTVYLAAHEKRKPLTVG